MSPSGAEVVANRAGAKPAVGNGDTEQGGQVGLRGTCGIDHRLPAVLLTVVGFQLHPGQAMLGDPLRGTFQAGSSPWRAAWSATASLPTVMRQPLR